MPLTFRTAGESHGKALLALVEGVPAGLPISADAVDKDLGRRMQGHGRGARMKIEQDRIEWISGVRAGETIGSPIAMLIHNRDWVMTGSVVQSCPKLSKMSTRRVLVALLLKFPLQKFFFSQPQLNHLSTISLNLSLHAIG